MKQRFEFDSFSQSIYDNLTGKSYHKLSEITKLLNEEEERANKNIEKVDNIYKEYWEYKTALKNLKILK